MALSLAVSFCITSGLESVLAPLTLVVGGAVGAAAAPAPATIVVSVDARET